MKSEMVKPTPDSAAPPAICGKVSPGASACGRIRVNSAVAPVMPTNLPITSPSTMPHVSGDVAAAVSVSRPRTTPALASAKIGTTRNAVYGW